MDERKQKVLWAIIQDYVSTAEPVGSRTLARKYDIGVSPATIRNEMSDLEEMGYIEQPHTSAGRIPSDFGYRYFVDCLMQREALQEYQRQQIRHTLIDKLQEVNMLMQQTTTILSQLTNYTAIVLGPQVGKTTFQRIQLIPIQPNKVVVVVVTSAGIMESRIIDVPDSVSADDLQLVADLINSELAGQTMKQVRNSLYRNLSQLLKKQKQVLVQSLELIDQAMQAEREEQVYLAGTLNIFKQPEFKDVEKIQNLLGILEEHDLVRNLLRGVESEGVSIKIGTENHHEGVRNCSMITATYQVDGEVLGVIGLLGPTRMEYSKSLAVVENLTEQLSVALKRLFGR